MVSKTTNKNLKWKSSRIATNPLAYANSEILQSSGFSNIVENSSENPVILSDKKDTCRDE